MAGFQIPIETKIDFLENIVIPFFDVRLDSSQTRQNWMTETAENFYGDKLQILIRSTNFIKSLEEAKAELREEKAEAKLREERAEAKLREERAFILQQQRAGTYISISYSSYFLMSSFLLNS
jgi:F0F1-type ATP synthase epsilon subunit